MPGLDLIGRLFGRMRDRDGRAIALEEIATASLSVTPVPAPGPDPDQALREAVATKLLAGWLANRHQVRVPHTLNFGVLGPEQAGLLLAVMAAAAQADGEVEAAEVERIRLALARVGARSAEAKALEDALAQPQPTAALLTRVQDEGLGPHAYAAALLAVGPRGRANRAFLDYLAARVGLSAGLMRGLERRYRM